MVGGTRGVSIASDDRARVPFAVIGVLVLVSSVTVVTTLQIRPDPDVDVEPSVAMDRAVSLAESELREATVRATEQAGLEPLTRASDTPVGRVLADGDPATADRSTVFVRYVKLRVYRQTREQLAGIEARVADDTRANVTLDPVTGPTSAAEAVSAVTLHVGGTELDYGDSFSDALGYGTVRVTIDGIRVDVVEDGDVVAEDTRSITTTVGTPLFQLHHLTDEYERQLNTNFSEAADYEGIGKFLAGRLVPLSYTRGYAQNWGQPVRQVLGARHVETMANDAILATQRHVFGHQDRRGDARLARAYACMLASDARGIYDDSTADSAAVETVADRIDGAGFCSDTNNLYADLGSDLSDPPKWRALLNETAFLDQPETVGLNESAEFAFGEVATDAAIQSAIDRVYTVDVDVDSTVSKQVVFGDPDADNTRLIKRDVLVTDVRRVYDRSDSDRVQQFYEIDVTFVGVYIRGGVNSKVRYDVTLTIAGEHSPDANVSGRGIDDDYERGPIDAEGERYGTNYAGVPREAVVEALAGVDSVGRLESQLQSHVLAVTRDGGSVDADSILTEADLVDALTTDDPELHPTPYDPASLRGWLVEDLDELEQTLSEERTTTPRHELFDTESPYEALNETVNEDTLVYEHVDGTYANVPDKVRAEARLAVLERLRDRVRERIDTYDTTRSQLDSALGPANLTNVTTFARRQMGPAPRTVPEASLPERDLLKGIRIVGDGEPTYLSFHRVEHMQVPAVDSPPEGFAPLASMEISRYRFPERQPGHRAVSLATAGTVLDAAIATDGLTTAGSWDSSRVDELEADVDAELQAVARQTAAVAARPFDGLSRSDLTPVVSEEIERLGPTETQAIQLGTNRTVRRYVAENVSEAFSPADAPRYDYFTWQFDAHLQAAIELGLERSLERTDTTEPRLAPLTESVARAVRDRLDDVGEEVVQQRLDQAATEGLSTTDLTPTGEQWLDSAVSTGAYSPNRVPAGREVVAEIGWNPITTAVWRINLTGEYKRFVTQSSVDAPATTASMQYVREAGTVTATIGGREVSLGRTEALRFNTSAPVLVAVPSERIGVGDRTSTQVTCSPTYGEVGPIDDLERSARCPGP